METLFYPTTAASNNRNSQAMETHLTCYRVYKQGQARSCGTTSLLNGHRRIVSGVKRSWCEADHVVASSGPNVKNEWRYNPTSANVLYILPPRKCRWIALNHATTVSPISLLLSNYTNKQTNEQTNISSNVNTFLSSSSKLTPRKWILPETLTVSQLAISDETRSQPCT